jgi:hypothetical protein
LSSRNGRRINHFDGKPPKSLNALPTPARHPKEKCFGGSQALGIFASFHYLHYATFRKLHYAALRPLHYAKTQDPAKEVHVRQHPHCLQAQRLVS